MKKLSWLFFLSMVLLTVLTLASCADTKAAITSYDHGKPVGTVETHQFLYGKMNYANLPFGITYMGNLDIGFGKLCNLISTLVAAYVAGDVAKAQEITKQLSNAGATQIQLAGIKTAAQNAALKITTDAKGSAYSTAVGAGAVPTVGTVTPP